MKSVLSVLLFSLVGCFGENPVEGNWRLDINLQDKKLPVLIQLDLPGEDGSLKGKLLNGGETLALDGMIKDDNTFVLDIAAHYSKLEGKIKGNKITGNWMRTNKENFAIPFSGGRTKSQSLYSEYTNHATSINLSGKWKIKLDEDKYGLGLFSQEGSRVQGSILTETGDYRFLDGYISENKLYLSGFDGVFSFILDGVIDKNQFVATMVAGTSTKKKITAQRDNDFDLKDPLSMTNLTSDKALTLSVTDIDGNKIDLAKGEYKGKAKVIQIFGSWCPNCHDETNFFVDWRGENSTLKNKVQFLALSFERTDSKEKAIRDLKKVRAKLKIDYDVALLGINKETKPEEFLPIETTIAFPTTLFLDKNNVIQKIHTGFAGQATGEYFSAFKRDFTETIEKLVE